MNNDTAPLVPKEKLFTRNYILTFLSSFMIFFAFYLLLPILPLYLAQQFNADSSTIGIVLAVYTITALLVRPFGGFLVDYFERKPLLVVAYTFFMLIFAGYIAACSILLFVVVRALHGLAFGLVTVSNSTMSMDVMPSSRRNEGIGYYGLSANFAMAIGPMTSLFILDTFHNYDLIFISSLIGGIIGLVCVNLIKIPKKDASIKNTSNAGPCKPKEPLSLDRFILLNALPSALALTLTSFSFGILSTYVAVYSVNEVGIKSGIGAFFIIMAAGLVIARTSSAKLMNKGELNKTVFMGMSLMVISYLIFIFLKSPVFFFSSALLLGLSYGFVCPSFQAMFINMARHDQRGTANSTYYISWDIGIGLGVLFGGQIAHISSFTTAYIVGVSLVAVALLYFKIFASGYYLRHRLQK